MNYKRIEEKSQTENGNRIDCLVIPSALYGFYNSHTSIGRSKSDMKAS